MLLLCEIKHFLDVEWLILFLSINAASYAVYVYNLSAVLLVCIFIVLSAIYLMSRAPLNSQLCYLRIFANDSPGVVIMAQSLVIDSILATLLIGYAFGISNVGFGSVMILASLSRLMIFLTVVFTNVSGLIQLLIIVVVSAPLLYFLTIFHLSNALDSEILRLACGLLCVSFVVTPLATRRLVLMQYLLKHGV